MLSSPRVLVLCFRTTRRRAIHTWFMRFPLTVLFVDHLGQIVDQVYRKPWSIYTPNRPAQYIVEIPGRIATKRGDRVTFK